MVGGFGSKDDELASATLYDPAHDAFSPTGSLVAARGYHTATLLADGRVLVTGGGPASWVDSRPYLASAELYDPKTGTFSPAGSMTMSRTVHTATRLVDGRVLIVGGNRVGDQTTAGAELFDPKTGTFSPTGSLTTARSFHTATLLADGRVLIAGGDPDPWTFVRATLTSAEIYDPTSGTFSPTGSMASARAAHTATLLPDGRVLITGGFDAATGPSIGFATAEVYDPKTGTFSTTRSMTDARVYHTASLLADGRVLVLGGGGNYTDRTFLASAEVYDPKTGSFAAIASMTSARTYHAATRLADGHILVTGGYGALAPLASAEIFDPGAGAFRLVP